MATPRVGIGMFVCNEERFIREAVDALLNQTYRDFVLVILDDLSTDSTWDIIQEYAKQDSRVIALRNAERQGYCTNYRLTYAAAPKGIEYFAWAAGHDRHHPEFLAKMVEALDTHPNAIMAYPLTFRIGEKGEPLNIPCPRFDTTGCDEAARISAFEHQGSGYGNMIYGLFRVPQLERAGVFPLYPFPDLLLFARMLLDGEFIQVEEDLWFRRFYAGYSENVVRRQLKNAFAKPPWHARVPWPICHYSHLLRHLVLKPSAGSLRRRLWGWKVAAAYRRAFFNKIPSSYPEYRSLWRAVVSCQMAWRRFCSSAKAALGMPVRADDSRANAGALSDDSFLSLPTAAGLTPIDVARRVGYVEFYERRRRSQDPQGTFGFAVLHKRLNQLLDACQVLGTYQTEEAVTKNYLKAANKSCEAGFALGYVEALCAELRQREQGEAIPQVAKSIEEAAGVLATAKTAVTDVTPEPALRDLVSNIESLQRVAGEILAKAVSVEPLLSVMSDTPDPQFSEADYLTRYPDVAKAVETGRIASGWEHFRQYGIHEGRTMS